MKNHFLTLIVIFIFRPVSAQHCPYDGAYIIVVNATAENDSLVLPNLRLTVLDSTGHTMVLDNREQDTLTFWKNPLKTSQGGIIDNEHPMNPWNIRFWFAEDNYVLVVGLGFEGETIKIEDIDDEANGGHFQTQEIELNHAYIYPLCTNHNLWDHGEAFGFVKNYAPIKVELKPLK